MSGQVVNVQDQLGGFQDNRLCIKQAVDERAAFKVASLQHETQSHEKIDHLI